MRGDVPTSMCLSCGCVQGKRIGKPKMEMNILLGGIGLIIAHIWRESD